MAQPSFVEIALTPVDELRRWGLRLGGRPLSRLLAERSRRVAMVGTASIALALGTTALCPLWAMLLGPLLLGVPHLLADARYLVLQPGLHRRRGFALLVGAPLAATLLWPSLPLGLGAVAGACLLARASRPARVSGAVLALGAALLVSRGGRAAEIVFAHLHNLIAVGLWWSWRPRRRGFQALPLLAFVAGAAAIAVGLVERAAVTGGGLGPILGGRVGVEAFLPSVSLLADPRWALRAFLFFAFAQSVHYAVWLRLIPDDARPRPGLRSFRSSLRALRADCGGPLLLLVAAVAVALLVGAASDPFAARTTYLRLALFHGPLELAVIAWRWLERAPRAPALS